MALTSSVSSHWVQTFQIENNNVVTGSLRHGAFLCRSSTTRARRLRMYVQVREYSLWGEEDPNGKDVESEEGIFETSRPTCRDVGYGMGVAEPRLVPEKWKDLQNELNRTKKQKRREILTNRLARIKEEKAKLREKLSSVIEEGIEQRRKEAAERGREETRMFRTLTEDFERDDGGEADVEDERFYATSDDERSDLSREEREFPPNNVMCDDIDRLKARDRTPRKVKTEDDYTLLKNLHFSPEEKKLFKSRKLDLDKIFSEKWMPLHALARAGQTYLLADLLERGARVDDYDKEGATALFRAVQAGRMGVSRHLIKRGANIHVRDKHGATLLHHGVASGNACVVKLLLKYGVEINAVDNEGWTSLHVAVQCQKKSIVRSLLKRGADRTMRSKDGNTPLDLAFGFASGFNSNVVIRLLKAQLPLLESMKGFKSCEEITAKLLREGGNTCVELSRD